MEEWSCNNGDEDWVCKYTCRDCVATDRDITPQEAQRQIMEERGVWDRVKKHDEDYRRAMANVKEDFPLVASGKQIKKIARSVIARIFEPMQNALLTKLRAVRVRSDLVGQAKEISEQLKRASTVAEAESRLEKLDGLQMDAIQASQPIAFKDRAKDLNEQWRFYLASTYGDLWTAIKDGNGTVIGSFTTWYYCAAKYGDGSICGTAISSKQWPRLFEDPMAFKQRYYCSVCGARYKTRYGMICELLFQEMVNGNAVIVSNYARCTIPEDEMDVKAIMIEQAYNPMSPEALYDALPMAKPHNMELLRKARPEELTRGTDATGVFRFIDPAFLDSCPLWEWKQLFTFVKNSGLDK